MSVVLKELVSKNVKIFIRDGDRVFGKTGKIVAVDDTFLRWITDGKEEFISIEPDAPTPIVRIEVL